MQAISNSRTTMQGKNVLITGATNGIGLATAQALAKMGAHVILVGRSREKTEQIARTITGETGAQTHALIADLSSAAQVRVLADDVRRRYARIDVLINNAGAVFADGRQTTVDGLEMTFALNHMSYFLLTCWLLELLKESAPARVINVSSSAHFTARSFNFDVLQGEQEGARYNGFGTYAQSKLANVLFTFALARRLARSGVTANALHPGVIASGFGRNNDVWYMRLFTTLSRPFVLTPERGAATTIYLASSPEAENQTGQYWDKSKPVQASKLAYDEALQERLWQFSTDIARQIGYPVDGSMTKENVPTP